MIHSKQRHSCLVILFCILSSLCFTPSSTSRAQTGADEGEARALVEQFFAAYAKKDLAGWSRLSDAKSPDFAARQKAVAQIFAAGEQLEVKNLVIRQVRIEGARASVRVSVEMSATARATGKPLAGLGPLNRTLRCVKEDGAWKVWSEISVAREIAEALASAPTEQQRAALLEAEKDSINTELLQAVLSQGSRYHNRTEFAPALAMHRLAREIAERLNDQLGQALALNGMGMAQDELGEYSLALAAYQQSLKLAEALKQTNGTFIVLNNIGALYAEQGNYDLALATFQEGLRLSESLNDQKNLATMLNNLANVYFSQGNYAQAAAHIQRSLELSEATGNQLQRAIALSALGNVYIKQGDLDVAEDYYQQSLALRQKEKSQFGVADTLTNLGQIERRRDHYERALGYYQQSLALREATNDIAGKGMALLNIGDIHRLQGQADQALKYYEQSLAIREKLGNQVGQASVLHSLSVLYEEQGRSEQAAETAERAAALARGSGNRELMWNIRATAGRAYDALHQPAQARQAFDDAIAVIEELRARVVGDAPETQRFFENKLDPYHGMVALLIAQQRAGEALAYAERAKGRVLLDVLRSGHANITKAMTASEQEQEQRLTQALYALNAQIIKARQQSKPDPARLAELEARLQKARLEHETFQTTLYATHPELKVQRGEAPPLKLDEADHLLPNAKTALLEYVVTEEKTYLFVLTRAEDGGTRRGGEGAKKGQGEGATEGAPFEPILKVYPLEIKQEDLTARTEHFRQQLATRDPDFKAAASGLYASLLKPAEQQLKGKTKLVIVPDGTLWNLPFQALQTGGQRFLIEDYVVSYTPSLTVLRELMKARARRPPRPADSPSLLAFGNPALGKEVVAQVKFTHSRGALSPLPEAEREVKTLARLYGAEHSKSYVGAEAREERLKAEAGKFSLLHLATHGVLNDASPMYSHIVLSQTEDNSKEDGLLEAWEIMRLNLSADLVVLSACETARGHIGAGEGVIGLSWALFVAGCPTTVVSQWQVESSSTTELMLEFHRSLKAKRTSSTVATLKAEALRDAALKLLRTNQYHHPFYWAGFVMVGDGN